MIPEVTNEKIKIHFFDMDHTLADNDCDVSWKHFVVAENIASPDALEKADYYYRQYAAGSLNQAEFLRFQLQEFVEHTKAEMQVLAEKHFQEFVKPKIYRDALEIVRNLKNQRLPIVLLTSTNSVVARPLANHFGMDECLGTKLETINDRYTGNIVGEYALGFGKVTHALDYCTCHNLSLAEAAYWGDSINDFNILNAVGQPLAANPAPELLKIARERSWEIVYFK